MNNDGKREYAISVLAKSKLTQAQFAALLGTTQGSFNRTITSNDRYPTNQHIAHLKAIELIIDQGLLGELRGRLR